MFRRLGCPILVSGTHNAPYHRILVKFTNLKYVHVHVWRMTWLERNTSTHVSEWTQDHLLASNAYNIMQQQQFGSSSSLRFAIDGLGQDWVETPSPLLRRASTCCCCYKSAASVVSVQQSLFDSWFIPAIIAQTWSLATARRRQPPPHLKQITRVQPTRVLSEPSCHHRLVYD